MIKIQTTRDAVRHCAKYFKGKTLDLGAGSGKYKSIIKFSVTEYVALDVAPGPNIDVVGDVLSTPFPDNSFDTIVSTQVIEHVQKPWVMVKEISRILRNDGICVMAAPFLAPYHADPGDYFRYTKDGLKFLFEDAGFEILEYASYGSFFATLSELIHFTFFSPYKGRAGKLAKFTMTSIERTARFLDRHIRPGPVYVASYVVAKKT